MIMKRYDLIDTLRGLAVISMIFYHACWIMNQFGIAVSSETVYGPMFIAWERSICIPFILIAGFSFSFGRHHVRTGLMLFGIGAAITAGTCLFVPQIRIVFGILTFIGTATLLMIPLDKITGRLRLKYRWLYKASLIISAVLFLFSYNINKGYIGFMPGLGVKLPQALYKGYVSTFVGFMEPGFFSTDYFSVLPWFFLYMCGYFLNRLIIGTWVADSVLTHGIPGVKAIGRHSLLIYVIHPIVLYLIFYLMSQNVLY